MRYAPAALFLSLMLSCACLFCLPAVPASADDAAVAAPAVEPGYDSLFDGKTLTGWIGNTKGYQVIDGAIACLGKGGGNLYTEKEYGDFSLKFDFKLTPGANNGIGIRTPTSGDAAYVGMEIQVLDDSAKKYATLHPYQYHGSIYGVAACERGHQKPVGEWNSEEIIAQGRHIKVILNGATIVDADLDKAAPGGKTIDEKSHPGLTNAKGHIGFLGHGDHVEFRNLRVKAL